MKFKSAQEVADLIKQGEQTRLTRSKNRTLVDNAVNGFPFLDDTRARQLGAEINVNFGEMPRLMAHARRQYETGLLGPEHFFKVFIRNAPIQQQTEWSTFVTDEINRTMKDCEEYQYLKEYQIGSLVNHGIGPQIWRDKQCWKPDFVAIDDLIIATDTYTSLKNCEWFGERMAYTEGELSEKVFGKNASGRWKKDAISKILAQYHPENYQNDGKNWINHPEKMADLIKQSGIYFTSDAVPTIPLIHFYYKETKRGKNATWKLCVVPDLEMGCRGAESDKFLYDSGDDEVAESISQLLCIQYGDLNSKAPFTHWAVRSLGYQLFEPSFWMNLTRCRELEHLIQSFDVWLKMTDPANKARPQKFSISNKGFMPDGVSIVPNNERPQVDPRMIEMVMSQLKQLQSEIATTYTQDVDTGTKKEQTAFEVQTKLSQVNAILAGLLGRLFRKEKYAYKEICRRFCLKGTRDEDAKKFQANCKKAGIPPQYINVEFWDVEPEIPIGSGNQTMAMAQAQQLMSIKGQLDPQPQRIVVHEFVEAVTGNSRMAKLLAPVLPERKLSNAEEYGMESFAVLMNGVPPLPKDGLPLAPQIEVLLGMVAGVISQATEQTNFTGVQASLQHVGQLIQQLSQDQSQQEKVKQFSQSLAKLTNDAKGAFQTIQKQKEQGTQNPKDVADAQIALKDAEVRNKIAEEDHALSLHQRSEEAARKARFDTENHQLDVRIKQRDAQLDAKVTMAETGAKIKAITVKTEVDARAKEELTKATIAAKEKAAENTEEKGEAED